MARARKSPYRLERHDVRILEVPAEADVVRLVAVADTHSRPHPSALEYIAAQDPLAILHGGDIGELEVLDTLATVAPVIPVRGNIDIRSPEIPDAITLDVRSGDSLRLRLLLLHIAVHGPRLRRDAWELAKTDDVDLIVCGHSHVPLIVRDRGFPVFNPGSIGPRRFALPIVFGVLELRPEGLDLWHVSCEDGSRWRPEA